VSLLNKWQYKTDGNKGVIYSEDNEVFPFQITEGQVQILLPFEVDRESVRRILEEERLYMTESPDVSLGWGENEEKENYYPYWVWTDSKNHRSILAFPPLDYNSVARNGLDTGEPVIDHEPFFGPKSMEEFSRWIGYMKNSAIRQG
jgi:hypothetical protein